MRKLVIFALGLILAALPLAARQSQPGTPRTGSPAVSSSGDLGATQQELLRLLRTSPKLTTVVVRDPSLLSDTDYVERNNPELANFLKEHAEITRNPEYYLFTNLGPDAGRTEWALEKKVWPELDNNESSDEGFIARSDVAPFLVFLCVLGALIWLVRVLFENRRWNRLFKLQSEVHGKLMERFGTSQEMLTYMETEAGKRFLEAAPIPVDMNQGHGLPSPLARILTPLQIGVVAALIGVGFFIIRHSATHSSVQLLAFGTLFLMIGIGFIISAGLTWALAGKLGLMPAKSEDPMHLEQR